MSAIMTCDNCGGTWDTGGNGHVCQPEDLIARLEENQEDVAGDLLAINARLRRIERFCERIDPRLWQKVAAR